MGTFIIAPSLHCSLEDIHNTLNTLNDAFYKMRHSQELFLYDFMQAKSHNEFKEVLEELTASINHPTTSVDALPAMNQYVKNMQISLDTIKTKTDVLESLRKSYQKESRTHAMTQRIALPRELEETDTTKKNLRTRERHVIDELNGITKKNERLLEEIKRKKEKAATDYDAQIYSACALFVTVLDNYLATVIKKAKHDFKI